MLFGNSDFPSTRINLSPFNNLSAEDTESVYELVYRRSAVRWHSHVVATIHPQLSRGKRPPLGSTGKEGAFN